MSSFKASQVKAPSAAGTLSLIRFEASEGLSMLGQYTLEVQGNKNELDANGLLGQTLGVGLSASDGGVRWVHGHISAVAQDDRFGQQGRYTLTLRPWLWLLTLAGHNRFFEEKTVIDVLKAVLDDYPGTVDWQVTGRYEALEYCVQYAESDFDFFSRLMERAGLYYFFTFEDGGHELVIVDAMSAHKTAAHCAKMSYRPHQTHFLASVSSWVSRSEMTTGKVSLQDYDFSKANSREASVQSGEAADAAGYELDDYERSLYPGFFADQRAGDAAAKVRVEALLARQCLAQATHSTPYLSPGHRFELTGHPQSAHNAKYLVVRSTLKGSCPESTGGLGELRFEGWVEVINTSQVFRAPILTPTPVIGGAQTAFVVGKSGEPQWVDKHGRIKVQFHWDNSGKENENCSCWVRVAQPMAGKRWGAMFLPRVGQEVVVQFLDGNPDRPLVVGGVYNAGTRPPWDLPDLASRSGFKTQSLGDEQVYNELRFEDKKDAEQLLIYAGRNQDVTVGNDAFVSVGNDWHISTGANQFVKVAKDLHESVEGSRNVKVSKDCSLSIDGDSHSEVGGKQYLTAGSVDVKGQQTITLEAGSELVLKVGSSSLVISASGVAINGVKVTIDGSAMVDINGGGGGVATGADAAQPVAATLPEEADNGQA
ncbi:type VI secretion system tip protein VgrG [Pseudomonas edaphica]|uniref:Type VI secretion system tip protein VgrG n=1 Tax=Pseudomonas edaphica TaxID=2006980 RepID=A0A7Y7V665_9PSED|nr:type VI secretion system tip protein TssI/VgrG [Pseudomonas edaphica]NVZ55860.1 type VI secretion system tip protein VgrG [Pseudomonas edaphica]